MTNLLLIQIQNKQMQLIQIQNGRDTITKLKKNKSSADTNTKCQRYNNKPSVDTNSK